MSIPLFRPLDRYVLSEFWKIYVMTALGFPVLLIIIDLTDNLDKYLNRELPRAQIALSYLYFIPDSMFLVMPAAVLFATVFSIGALTRHSEITDMLHRIARPRSRRPLMSHQPGPRLREWRCRGSSEEGRRSLRKGRDLRHPTQTPARLSRRAATGPESWS